VTASSVSTSTRSSCAGCLRSHAGVGPGVAASLIIRLGTRQPSVALANRRFPIEPVNIRLVRPIA
jgi:hypothetical protein